MVGQEMDKTTYKALSLDHSLEEICAALCVRMRNEYYAMPILARDGSDILIGQSVGARPLGRLGAIEQVHIKVIPGRRRLISKS